MLHIDNSHQSPNFNDRRGATIDMVIIHYTDMDNADEAIQRLCDPSTEVSSHYVIAADGRIFCLVPEQHRAWHAGVAHWNGADNINDRSVGIELDYVGHRGGLPEYPQIQIDALIKLLHDIHQRHDIPHNRVLGHEDVAPIRKKDPGENFPWQQLYDAQVASKP